jgi:outer membrane protein TolC
MKAFWLLVGLSAYSSFGWAVTYGELLPNVMAKLPETQQLSDYQALSNANRQAADSWIPGEVELNLKHENDGLTGDQGFRSWEGGATFPIWWPGQSGHQSAIGDGYQQQTQAGQAQLALMASKQLRQVVWQTKKAAMRLKFGRKNLQQTQALVDLVQQKVDAGESPKFDLLLAQKSLYDAEKRLTQLQADYDVALQHYQFWTQQTELPSPLAETLVASAPELDSHPEVQSLAARQKTEQARLDLVEASRHSNPNLYLAAKNERDDQTADNNILIAEIRIPIGSNPMAPTRIAEQRQQLSQSQMALARVKQQLEMDQFQARQSLQAAQKNETLAAEQNALAEEAMRLAQTAYQEGETSIQNLLQMKQQYFEDKLNFKLARLNRLEAIANLNQALGVRLK